MVSRQMVRIPEARKLARQIMDMRTMSMQTAMKAAMTTACRKILKKNCRTTGTLLLPGTS